MHFQSDDGIVYLSNRPQVSLGVSAGFAPWRVRPHINSSSDQVLQIYRSHTEKKRQHCAHDETKHVYFSFFNPLKVTDKLELESLG